MKLNIKSRKGFTLIELLVVIGILAVLAAIAIPSVAGLIDRANVSTDNTNANEMTSAIERFTSEYELYCQDIASGRLKDKNGDGIPDDMDSAQGRVYNVTGIITRGDIEKLESCGHNDSVITRDTKYPANLVTLEKVIENYTKTSSATFTPKQSDCEFYYSQDCGIVICATKGTSVENLNKYIVSGQDAKGNTLTDETNWMNVASIVNMKEGLVLKGDVNADGFIDAKDAVLLKSETLGINTSYIDIIAADINNDGLLTISDTGKINAFLKGHNITNVGIWVTR